MREDVEMIELRAVRPDGDIACDTTIATPKVLEELRTALARGIRPPVEEIAGGVRVQFAPESYDDVMRYVDVESRCCSFLDLSVRRAADAVVLTVTGREDARSFIRQIFAGVERAATRQGPT